MGGFIQEQTVPEQASNCPDVITRGSGETASRVGQQTNARTNRLYRRFGKRILDLLVALVALVLASPILFLCAVAVWLDSPGPIFYRQWRVGQKNRRFQLIKLRTMIHRADKQGSRITGSGDPRVTRVGKFLRRTKLDEVPQFLNVLRGEMSLAGPRPEVEEYTAKYTFKEKNVLDVKPGITGPASLAYVDEECLLASRTDKEDFYVNTVMRLKLQLDLAYCSKISFVEDLRILFLTVKTVFSPWRSCHRQN
jgi:lipopolysaccharide/colanic/teichoic acid biosynthesis glycosyltransferase